MLKRYQSFMPEFREEAAEMVDDGSRTIAEVASGGRPSSAGVRKSCRTGGTAEDQDRD
jgi:hypothetical protein